MTGQHVHVIGAGAGTMVLDHEISAVHRDRDFGRIEALVTLYVKRRGQPVHPVRIHANVEDRGAQPLRVRLVRDAMRLADHFAQHPATRGLDRAA